MPNRAKMAVKAYVFAPFARHKLRFHSFYMQFLFRGSGVSFQLILRFFSVNTME